MLMNHLSRITLLGAVALLAAVGCQREPVDNPNPNSDTNEVNTTLVFNIEMSQSETKQTADAVQANGSNSFRGLNDAWLLTYAQATNGKILAADANADKAIDLAKLAATTDISDSKSRRVLEMSLPLKTNTLLLYGKAPQSALPAGVTGVSIDDYYGKMYDDDATDKNGYKVGANEGDCEFTLGRRLTDATKYHQVEKYIAGILSCVMNTSVGAEDHFAAGDKPTGAGSNTYGYTVAACPSVNWRSYAYKSDDVTKQTNSPVETDHVLYPLEEKLAHVYEQVTTINSDDGEIRAGSSQAVVRTIQDMWTVVNEVRCAAPLSEAEAVAKYLSQKIHERLSNYILASVPANGGPVLPQTGSTYLEFAAPNSGTPTVANKLANDSAWPNASGKLTEAQYLALADVDLSNFPLYFNVPRGGAHYVFNSSSKLFEYVQSFNTSAMDGITIGGESPKYNVSSYFYPAELMYFGNSPIRTSDTEHKTDDYPKGGTSVSTDAWETSAIWSSGWQNPGAVQASTKSVAMTYNINYGTALLKTQVKYGASTLYDNNHEIQKARTTSTLIDPPASDPNKQTGVDEPNKPISVDGTSFVLTGIIIGGQPHKVGWDYLPFKGHDEKRTYGFVYDRYMGAVAGNSIPAPGSASTAVYTSVLDTYNDDPAQEQHTVYVALEFQNKTDADFYGNQNLIQKDGYFYLIGALDPYDRTNPTAPVLKSVTWPTYYKIPPYYTAADETAGTIPTGSAVGDSKKTTRVFIQDYMTSVTFMLGENSLKYAYLTVPDLRSSSLTLGLSVDIHWETGLVFDNVILGGN